VFHISERNGAAKADSTPFPPPPSYVFHISKKKKSFKSMPHLVRHPQVRGQRCAHARPPEARIEAGVDVAVVGVGDGRKLGGILWPGDADSNQRIASFECS
jgi:hypothetical protein